MFYSLQCISCKKEFNETQTVTTCLSCHSPLDIKYDYKRIKQRLNSFALENAPISAIKYLDFYPILNLGQIITLKEGGTPLYKAKNLEKKYGLKNIYVKNEGANPTGVFKDRGTLVEITKALEVGAKAICLASSGNMAASCAAYAALAKIPCYVLVPEGTPIGKLSQSLTYGARVIQIRDVYSTCAKLAEELAIKHNFYLAGDYVFRREGQKSQAYEIIEQLYWKSPDYVVCPIGVGTNLSAIWKGFVEFYNLGLIDKLPKIIGVQPSGCNPVVQAVLSHRPVKPMEKIQTVCSAVAVSNPLDAPLVIKAIKDSKGTAVSVGDDETLAMEQTLGRSESIFVEPSGALSVAAVEQLAHKNFFKPTDVIVCVVTGNGLKDPITALRNLPKPPTLEPDIREINQYIDLKLYQIRGAMMKSKEDRIWHKLPTKPDLKKLIKKEFNINLNHKLLDEVYNQTKNFTEKTDKMRRADLQLIIEEVLKEYTAQTKVLEVIDFKLEVSKHKKAQANVILTFKKEKITAQAEGVGPVDAIIKAIQTAIVGKDKLECRLIDFNVTIDTEETDAVVEVRIKVKAKNGHEVTGSATSPDIIVASIEAFVKGYNALCAKQ